MASYRQRLSLVNGPDPVTKVAAYGKPLRIVYAVLPWTRINPYLHYLWLSIWFNTCCDHKTWYGVISKITRHWTVNYRCCRWAVFLYRVANYKSRNCIKCIRNAYSITGIPTGYL